MSKLAAYAGVARAPFLLLPVTLVASGAAAAAYDDRASVLATVLAAHRPRRAACRGERVQRSQRHAVRHRPADHPDAVQRRQRHAALGGPVGWWRRGRGRRGLHRRPAHRDLLRHADRLVAARRRDGARRRGGADLHAGVRADRRRASSSPASASACCPWSAPRSSSAATIGPAAWAAGVPAFLMTFNLLLLNEFPDEKADRAGGRRNLVLLLGRPARGARLRRGGCGDAAGDRRGGLARWLPGARADRRPAVLVRRPGGSVGGRRSPSEPVPIPAMAGNVIWNLATNTLLGGWASALPRTWGGRRRHPGLKPGYDALLQRFRRRRTRGRASTPSA